MTQTAPAGRARDLVDALQIRPSHIVYELVHAPQATIPPAQYETTMAALEAALVAESARLADEAAARGYDGARVGVVWSSTLRLEPSDAPARAYLTRLGLPDGVPLYETRVGIDRATNLDVLEHLIRDRIGVYGGPHGQHVREQAMFVASIRNLVAAEGNPPGARDASGRGAIIYMTKPFGAPESFRSALREGLAAARGAGVEGLSVWERKLGLGPGLDFTLRLDGLATVESLDRVVDAMREAGGDAVREALARGVTVLAARTGA